MFVVLSTPQCPVILDELTNVVEFRSMFQTMNQSATISFSVGENSTSNPFSQLTVTNTELLSFISFSIKRNLSNDYRFSFFF